MKCSFNEVPEMFRPGSSTTRSCGRCFDDPAEVTENV